VDNPDDTDAMFETASNWIPDHNIAQRGCRIILAAGVPIGIPGTTNRLKTAELKAGRPGLTEDSGQKSENRAWMTEGRRFGLKVSRHLIIKIRPCRIGSTPIGRAPRKAGSKHPLRLRTADQKMPADAAKAGWKYNPGKV